MIDNLIDDMIFATLKLGCWKTDEEYSLYIEYRNTEEEGIQGKF